MLAIIFDLNYLLQIPNEECFYHYIYDIKLSARRQLNHKISPVRATKDFVFLLDHCFLTSYWRFTVLNIQKHPTE